MPGFIPTRETSSLVVQLGYAFQATFSAGSAVITPVGFAFSSADVGDVVMVLSGNLNPGNPGVAVTWTTVQSVNVGGGTMTLAAPIPQNSTAFPNVVLYRPLTGLVNYALSGSVSVDLSLTQDSTAQFTIVSLDGSLIVNAANTTAPERVGMPVLITDTEVGVDYFGGPIDQSRNYNEPGTKVVYSECQAKGWNILALRRNTGVSDAVADGDSTLGAANPASGQFINNTPDQIIAYWVRNAAFDDGMTTLLDTTGPQLPTFSSIGAKLSDGLDQLVAASTPLAGTPQFQWFVDPRRVLNFIKQGSLTAPFNISDADGSDAFFEMLVQNTISRQNYFNRGIAEVDSVSQTFIGDGSTTSFTLSQAVPNSALGQVRISVSFGSQPLLGFQSQNVGVAGVDIGKQWYYTIGSKTITSVGNATPWASNVSYNLNDVVTRNGSLSSTNLFRSLASSNKGNDPNTSPTYWAHWGASGPLGTSDVMTVSFPIFAILAFDDLPAQATQQAIESGSGIWEQKINLNALNSVVDAETFVTSQVEIAKDYAQQIQVTTYKPGLNLGQTVQVNLKDIGVDSHGSPAIGAFFLIDSVKIKTNNNRKLFTITASIDAPLVGGPYAQLKRGLGTGGGVNAHPLSIPLSASGNAAGVSAGSPGGGTGTGGNPTGGGGQTPEANLIPVRSWIDETGRQPLLNAMNNTETVPVHYNGRLFFAAACNDGTFQVFKSTDQGRTWAAVDSAHAPADVSSPSLSGMSGSCAYDGGYKLHCAFVQPNLSKALQLQTFNLATELWGSAFGAAGPIADFVCSVFWRPLNRSIFVTYNHRGSPAAGSVFKGISWSLDGAAWGTELDVGLALQSNVSRGDVNSSFSTGVVDANSRIHFLLDTADGANFWYQAVEIGDTRGSTFFFNKAGVGDISTYIAHSNVVISTSPAGVQRVTAVVVTKE